MLVATAPIAADVADALSPDELLDVLGPSDADDRASWQAERARRAWPEDPQQRLQVETEAGVVSLRAYRLRRRHAP